MAYGFTSADTSVVWMFTLGGLAGRLLIYLVMKESGLSYLSTPILKSASGKPYLVQNLTAQIILG